MCFGFVVTGLRFSISALAAGRAALTNSLVARTADEDRFEECATAAAEASLATDRVTFCAGALALPALDALVFALADA
jgi:hypothetical protein